MIKSIVLALTLAIGALASRSDDLCNQAFSADYPAVNHNCKALLKPVLLPLHMAFAGQSDQRERRVSVFNVANAAELSTALGKAVGGDVIKLAAGEYGAYRLNGMTPTGLVTITSADPQAQAHFSSLTITNAENFAFRNVDIGRALNAGEGDYTRMVDVRSSAKIVFDHVNIHGSVDGNYNNDGYGIGASNVDGLVITGSNFSDLTKGMVVQQMKNLQIDNNSFRDMRSDGINVAASSNVLIDKNLFQGFHPADGDHGDAIQFYNLGQPYGSSDIVIRNNVLLPGGTGPQGIWLAQPDPGGFVNVTIENNLLWSSGLYNGLSVSGGTNVKIIGNTVVSPANDDKSFWIRLENNTGVEMRGNITDNVILQGTNTDVRDSGNTVFTKDPGARGLIPNLDAPTGIQDLITPGKGYHIPTTPEGSPVASAIGGSIGNMLAGATGSSVSKAAIVDQHEIAPQSDGTIDLGAFAAPAPVETASVAHMPAVASSVSHFPSMQTYMAYLTLEHFTALP